MMFLALFFLRAFVPFCKSTIILMLIPSRRNDCSIRKFLISVLTLSFFVLAFSSLKVLIIYESSYDDDSILLLPLAKKDALNLKEALSRIQKMG